MLVKEIMTRNVECVQRNDSLQTAARKMRDLDIGPLPVCGENNQLAGIVTDRDITIRATAEGWDPTLATVKDVMTTDITYVYEDQDVRDAADTMASRQIRRVLVLNQDERLSGIVSLADIALDDKQVSGIVPLANVMLDGGSDARTANTLRHVSKPAEAKQ